MSQNRMRALGVSNYLRQILASVLGHDVATLIRMRGLTIQDDREIVITLSLDDAQKVADALNREPEGR